MEAQSTEPVFGLDIGTRSLVGTVGIRENDRKFKVMAIETLEHETRAMIDGQIHDIPKVSASIRKIKKSLEGKLERPLQEVCIAAAGRVLKTVNVSPVLDLSEEKIIHDEEIHSLEMLGVEEAYEKIRGKDADSDFYCVGYSVMRYYLDGQQLSNLSEHRGSLIEAEMIATFLPQSVVDDLYSSVELAGLHVANLTLEPIAAIDVAIPEKFRLLNIALVDVGAGTSDICVTNDGCVMAYGMIPHAGDEITEIIAKHCLVDFNTADEIKKGTGEGEEVTFKDIMDLPQTARSEEILSVVKPAVDSIAEEVAEKIKELNGGKPVSAVFVVGGGGKISGFTEKIAEVLSIPKERVALRGKEVLGEVDFADETIQKDPILVTPIGICYSFYEARNNFLYVTVNGNRVKLYDNGKLTVLDVLAKDGYTNEDLFPKRGKTLTYTVDGERRTKRGESGDAAEIRLNGSPAGITKTVSKNDSITVRPSTAGAPAELMIRDLKEAKGSFTVHYNDRIVECPLLSEVNGELVSGFYDVKEGDRIVIRKYYTLSQVMEMLDLPYHSGILVNNMLANADTKIYDNFTVTDMITKDGGPESRIEAVKEVTFVSKSKDLLVYVNGEPVLLTGKSSYVVVDILDFYEIDLSTYRGELIIEVNGERGKDFSTAISEGDRVKLGWSKDE